MGEDVRDAGRVRDLVVKPAGQAAGCWIGPAPDKLPTLVVLHGGLACLATWHDFPQALAEATGCGCSTPFTTIN